MGAFEPGRRRVEQVENKVRDGVSITQQEARILESRYIINSQKPTGGMVRVTQATPRNSMGNKTLQPIFLKR